MPRPDFVTDPERVGSQREAVIEFFGRNGLYANVNFDRKYLPGGKGYTIVSPGACSLPKVLRMGEIRNPTDQFYYEFEESIGIDPWTIRKGQPSYVFVVFDNGRSIRVNALSPKLARYMMKRL